MTEIQPENTQNPNQSFFSDKPPEQRTSSQHSTATGSSAGSTEFIGKGSNRRLNENWDIHFILSAPAFINLITFISDIGYDAMFIFKKRELIIVDIDSANTHAATIKIEKTEFTDYVVKGLEKDDDEKVVYIDTSIIIDELSVNENYPVDFYVDTLEKNRFYVVNGKEIVRRQLSVTSEGTESIIGRYKSFLDMMNRLITRKEYQKIIANQNPVMGLIKSLNKKKSQKKNESVIVDLSLSKIELDFQIQDENGIKGSSIVLSGEDILVYPMESDLLKFNLEYFNKLGKLKMTFNVAMYICGNKAGNSLPLVVETRFGGGRIIMNYLIAPRVETND